MLGDKIRILKPQNQLHNLPDDCGYFSSGYFGQICKMTSINGRYLAGLLCNILYSTSPSSNEPDDIESGEEEGEVTSSIIQLQKELGTSTREEGELSTQRFSRVKQPEKFFHSALMLYKPW